jgi:hypothetical protein
LGVNHPKILRTGVDSFFKFSQLETINNLALNVN